MEKFNLLASAETAKFSLGDFLVSLQGKPQMTEPVQTRVSRAGIPGILNWIILCWEDLSCASQDVEQHTYLIPTRFYGCLSQL